MDEEFSSFISSFDCKKMEVEKDEGFVVAEAVDGPSSHQEVENEESSGNHQKHLEFFIDQDDCHLIPVELMDSNESQSGFMFREEDQGVYGNGDLILDFDDCSPITPVELVVEKNSASGEVLALTKDESSFAAIESMEMDEGKVAAAQATQMSLMDVDYVQQRDATEGGNDSNVEQVADEKIDEIEANVSIGTDIPDHEPVDDVRTREFVPSACSAELYADDTHGPRHYEEETLEFNIVTDESSNHTFSNHLLLSSEFNETEEDKVPDTPTSIDSFHHLQKKLLLLERKESGAEESFDGSVMSDIEGGDGVLTVEKLKSALKSERKVLRALYEELEEERSASAVAASQTMAMINRLQEEKAAMQMEALQYQRMMEEQSEYDQEALQLLNELMVKRERELDVCRKKLQHFEAKEKMMMLRRSATSSTSCSNAEDSDGLSVDLNQESKEEDSFDVNTPADAVLCMEESLADFEEERLSILEQLKVLEEKLVTLNDEEEEQDFDGEVNGNGYHDDSDFLSNGIANAHFNGNGKHHEHIKIPGPKAKRLLPLFNAADAESEDSLSNGHENGYEYPFLSHHSSATSFDSDNKKVAIEEEVDHVYDRLQALEADREFLKHCISSLRKGDKGVHLLQEILQHLRDLRSVESRARNIGDSAT